MDSFYVPPVTLRLFISSNWNPAVPEQINIYRFGTTWGKKSPSWSSYMEKMFSAPSTYFPSQVSDMMHQDRAFATVHLSMSGLKNISSMTLLFESDDENQVVSDPEVGSPSYASTVATTSSQDSPSSCSLTGYSEDGGAKKGKLIPEHEFADGPVRQMMKRNFFKLTFKTPEIF